MFRLAKDFAKTVSRRLSDSSSTRWCTTSFLDEAVLLLLSLDLSLNSVHLSKRTLTAVHSRINQRRVVCSVAVVNLLAWDVAGSVSAKEAASLPFPRHQRRSCLRGRLTLPACFCFQPLGLWLGASAVTLTTSSRRGSFPDAPARACAAVLRWPRCCGGRPGCARKSTAARGHRGRRTRRCVLPQLVLSETTVTLTQVPLALNLPGLTTAYRLQLAGVNTILYEGNSRWGGRAYSGSFPNGQIYEHG